jgi:hypothetical protein
MLLMLGRLVEAIPVRHDSAAMATERGEILYAASAIVSLSPIADKAGDLVVAPTLLPQLWIRQCEAHSSP